MTKKVPEECSPGFMVLRWRVCRDCLACGWSGLIDEMMRMAQSPRAMIRFGIFLALLTFCVAARSQTNRWTPKKMSLEDCIETALQHNLDVRIQRYNPEIKLYNLNADYGAY